MASPHVIWGTSLALTGLEVYDVVSDIWNNLTLRSIPNETIHDAVGWLNFHLMTVIGLNLLLFFLWLYLRSGPGWRLVRAEFGPQAVRLLDLVSFFNAGCQRIPIEHAIKFTEAASDSELRQHTEGESLSRGELLQELYKLKSQLERVALVPRFYEDVIQTGLQLYIVYVQLQLGESLKASQWMSLAGSTFNFYAAVVGEVVKQVLHDGDPTPPEKRKAAAGCEDAAFRDLVSRNLLADLFGVASLLSRCYLCAAIGDELIQEILLKLHLGFFLVHVLCQLAMLRCEREHLQHLRGFPVLFVFNPAVFILPATFASESLARLYGFQGKRLGDERRDARKHHFDAGIHVGAGAGFLCRVFVLALIAFLFKLDYFEVSTRMLICLALPDLVRFLWTLVDFANSCEHRESRDYGLLVTVRDLQVSSREPAASKKVQEVCCVLLFFMFLLGTCGVWLLGSRRPQVEQTLVVDGFSPEANGIYSLAGFSENRPLYKRAGGGMNLFYHHNRSVAATRDQWLLSPDMPAFYAESVDEFKDAASGSVSPTSMSATQVRTWSRQTGSVHSLPNYTSFVLTSLEDHPFRGTWIWSEGTTIRWGLLFSSKRRQGLHHGRPVLELVKPFDNGTKAKSFRISFSHEHRGWALKENGELRFLLKASTAFPFDEPSDDFKELAGWHKWEGGQCAQATRPLLIGKACHPQCLGCTGAGNKRCLHCRSLTAKNGECTGSCSLHEVAVKGQCTDACSGHRCPADHLLQINAAELPGTTDDICCTAACSGHQCPADYVLKKNAAELAGTADDICCLKWYLQAKSWRELDAVSTKPPKTSGHTAVYDPQGKAMVIFGGWGIYGTHSDHFDDTWAFDLAAKTWHEVVVASTKPPKRSGHTAVYDPQGKAMVIFGGYGGHDRLDDTWAFDLAAKTWHELVVASTKPPTRSYHTAVYDPQGKAMVVFGGYDDFAHGLDDTWAFDLAAKTWHEVVVASTKPPKRSGHTAVYDPQGKAMVIFGGYGGHGTDHFDDTWAFDLAAKSWRELDAVSTKPPKRNIHTAVYDPQGKAMVIFGGWGGFGTDRLDDTWAFDLAAKSWRELVVASTKPPRRSGHTAVYDPQGKAMVIFGGSDGHNPDQLDDTWAFDLAGAPKQVE